MSAVQVRRWTRREYERMTDAGVLTENDRVELIGGEILTVTPQKSAHATTVSLADEALARERVAEYWILNLVESVVEIYRDPTEDPSARFGWSYAQSKRVARTESIALPFGGVASAADLLP